MDDLPGEPTCPQDGTVLRVDAQGWVCGWCGHRAPLDDPPPAGSSDLPGIHGG